MNVKLVLFDLDGTLLNSTRLIQCSFAHVFNLYNIPGYRMALCRNNGASLYEAYAAIVPEAEVPKCMEAHRAFQSENLHLVDIYDDVITTIEELRALGIYIAAITNRSNAQAVLQHCGIASLFDLIISTNEVKNAKPHPEGIEMALKHFHADPAEAVMVGDTPIDIIAGKAAHVTTVGVETSENVPELVKSGPDYLIKSISAFLPLLFA